MAILITVSCLMTLERYRNLHRLTYLRLAELIGLRGTGAVRTVQRYATGMRFPPPSVLRRIREVTAGAVTADDFVDQHTTLSSHCRKGCSDGHVPLSQLEPSGGRSDAPDGRRWPYQTGRRNRLEADG
ncbi:MAG: hypothetical protein ACREFP_27460 [Acetobacteraceae bacterium]